MGTKPVTGSVNSPLILTKIEPPKQNSGNNFAEVLKSKQRRASPPPEPATASPIEYTVKRGDTLWDIAQKFDIKDHRQIIKDNKIARPDVIHPGQKIVLYPSSANTAQPENTSADKTLPFGTKPLIDSINRPQILSASESTTQNSVNNFDDALKAAQSGTSTSPEPTAIPPSPIEYTVKRGDTLWDIAKQFDNKDLRQIIKDNNIARPDSIYPGQKISIYPSPAKTAQTAAATPAPEQPNTGVDMTASWYGAAHHNKTTSSGQRYDMHKNTLAHKTLPFGTKVKLVNPENGKVAEGVVNDRGPFIKGRDIDVSYALAKQLGFAEKGVTKLNVEII